MSYDEKSRDEAISHLEQVETPLEEKMHGDKMAIAAKEAATLEHELSPLEAIKAYPMAIFWSIMVSIYDTILIGNFFAYPTFKAKYGTYFPELNNGAGGYQLTAAWQAGLGNCSGVGAFFGVLLCGYLVGIFGQKRVLLGSLIVLSAFVFMTFFAPSIAVLASGELLCGLPWGVFATVGPAYASEVLPLCLRVYLTSYTNMCFIIGQLIAAGVLEGCLSITSEWAYRIPFALQWFWPAFLFPVLLFCPESPWHLAREGKLEEAERSLNRLVRKSANINTKETLANIVHTNELEKQLTVGTSYLDCFKGPERRRTEIACVVFAGQVLSGSTFAYNSSYFFEQVGLSSNVTYKLNLGGTSLALVGTLISWFTLMPYFGRRNIYLSGMATMTAILFIIGVLNVKTENHSIGMAQAVLTLAWTFVFQLSAGQLGWALPAEMGSTRLRQKTICLARNSYYVVSVISGVLEPYFMNPTAWNLKGYTGFVWGGTALATLIWGYFRLPETKGRSYEELDILFAKGVRARDFKGYQVDAFNEETINDATRRCSTV
ncbi:putative alpha-glucoside transport protein-1 [Coleophoma crateriformis]|uniref:Putative alpha-glucoside transport protein-1 n=1 Tax=Coleophoma crateriformis TaxID=565419 RepID=A0A3D8QEK3_9HELO|nr:putative alpha-glucoside transport protein-1 [Coleophoma crateriformis]